MEKGGFAKGILGPKSTKEMAGRRPNASTGRGNRNPMSGLGRYFGGNQPKVNLRRILDNWRNYETDKTEETFEPLEVKKFNNNIKRNSFEHHTVDLAEEKYFAIRRGQPFTVDLDLNRPYDQNKDDLVVVMQYGTDPSLKEGTDVELYLKTSKEHLDWNVAIGSNTGNTLKLKITPPPDCYIGKWKLMVDSIIPVTRGDKKLRVRENIYEYSEKVYVLFNAWCKDDDVYIDDEEKRQEYVLNETGCIYYGSGWYPSPRDWVFGQFEGVVLELSLILLKDYAWVRDKDMGDPIKIARQISAVVNSSDEFGVLTGNWSGDYEDGTSPLKWTGSVEILEEFYKTRSPVKYGQCWVFSGVVTTVCRALGLPCRSVTNFSSAHDTDGSVTIDTVYDEEGNEIEELCNDSVWNFHVWNDVWMKRPDLPDGYDGWQAVDATPQELSGGSYCMGPAPLRAIKEGNIYLMYDAPFVFAEVNGDRVDWVKKNDGTLTITHTKENSVGKSISTKAVGLDRRREDLTDEYKHREKGTRNKAAVARANRHGKKAKYFDDGTVKDVEINVVVPEKEMYIGEDFKWDVKLANTSNETRTVTGRVILSSCFYTGHPCKRIPTDPIEEMVLKPKEERIFGNKVPAEVYFKYLTDYCEISVQVKMDVKETKQILTDKETLDLNKPTLQIQFPREWTVGKSTEVTVYFTNPLDIPLTNCELRVMGPGIQTSRVIPQKNVKAKAKFEGKFSMTPVKAGNRQVVVNFNCDELFGINNSRGLLVNKPEDDNDE